MFRLWRLEFHAFKTLKWKCGFLLSILFASSLPVFRPSFLLYPNFRDRGLNSNKQQLYRQDFHIDMNPWNGLGTGILLKLAWSNDCFRRHSDWQWLAARTKIRLHPKVGQDRRTTHHNGMLQRNQDSQQLSNNWPCTMWAGWCVFLPELSTAAVSGTRRRERPASRSDLSRMAATTLETGPKVLARAPGLTECQQPPSNSINHRKNLYSRRGRDRGREDVYVSNSPTLTLG